MKRDISKYIRQAAKEVAMTREERECLLYTLREYMEFRPLRRVVPAHRRPFLAWHYIAVYMRPLLRYQVFLTLLLILIGTGGIAYAAEGTVPGDPLYGFKVDVSEEVRGALTFSPEGKAIWEARRAERRLEEASLLAAQKKLTDEKTTMIESAFDTQVHSAERSILRLQKENSPAAIELASHIETALNAHSAILSKLVEEERAEGEGKKKNQDFSHIGASFRIFSNAAQHD